ncbi:hypothetical protein CHS0354_025471 [Potamilus streckersoni]|uniref:Cytochrome P450 n=1 Tax=Potamilus streckersoni TaxID=2493646 RepID=A0AAE0RRN1_9BIVA|nr:hypothetical protein CHS0354_025471 [Potamilus streckersoni]
MLGELLHNVNIITALVFILVFMLVYHGTRVPSYIPPYPKPVLPMFGNLLYLANRDILLCFRKLRAQYGNIFSFYMGSQLVVVLNGYITIKEALVKYGRVFSDRPINFLTEELFQGSGLVFTSGEKWKEHRRFVMNALQELGFGRSSFEENIIQEAEELVNIFDEQNGQPFQIKGGVNTCVANVVAQIIFGQRFKHTDPHFREFLSILEHATKTMSNTSVAVNCFPFLQYFPGDPLKMKLIKEHVKKVVQWYKDMHQEHKSTYKEGAERDFIDLYITEARRQGQNGQLSTFTDTQLYFSIGDLISAGSDTTANTIQWTLLYFLHFPEIQRKCFQEIEQVVGRERLPNLQDKEHLPYLEATILEVLRLCPAAPLALPHSLSEDFIFRGYRISKGTTVLINLESVLRDPSSFKDPERFFPERYLDADGHLIKPKEHIPFSIGRRMCLGENVARMELFLFLAVLIQSFEFHPVQGESLPELNGILGITYSPKSFLIRAMRRK